MVIRILLTEQDFEFENDPTISLRFVSGGVSGGTGSFRCVSRDFTHLDSGEITFGALAPGEVVVDSHVQIDQAFDGVGAAIDVGTESDPQALLSGSGTMDVCPEMAATGFYGCGLVNFNQVGALDLTLTLTPGAGASAGTGTATIFIAQC